MAKRSPSLLRRQVERDAGQRCGYCLVPQEFLPVRLELEHLRPRSLDGATERSNLWLSCPTCNCYKRDLISASDSETGRTVRLFNPRTDTWTEHFIWSKDGLRIIGRTAIGRASVATLRLNHELWLPSPKRPPARTMNTPWFRTGLSVSCDWPSDHSASNRPLRSVIAFTRYPSASRTSGSLRSVALAIG